MYNNLNVKNKELLNFTTFTKDSVIRNSLIWATIFWLANITSLAFVFKRLPPLVPFFYSLVRGENQLARKEFLFLLPTLSLVFISAHTIFSRINFDIDPVFSRIIQLSAWLISFLFTIAILHIVVITL